MLMSTMSSLNMHKHKHEKKAYAYAHVAAVLASYAYVYSCACVASEGRPLTTVHKCRINQDPPYLYNLFHNRFSASRRSTRNNSKSNLPKCRLSGNWSTLFCLSQSKRTYFQNTFERATISCFKRKADAYFF